jgi:hypothetical protein
VRFSCTACCSAHYFQRHAACVTCYFAGQIKDLKSFDIRIVPWKDGDDLAAYGFGTLPSIFPIDPRKF